MPTVNVGLNASANPNVDGNVTAGGNVTGAGNVTGTITSNVTPLPVGDQCSGPQLAAQAITAEGIQGYRDNAGTTISGNYNQSGGNVTYTGVVHVTGNMIVSGNMTLTGNVIFVVDGNVEITAPGKLQNSPAGSTVTFLVPTGNLTVKGNGNFQIDGHAQVGTVDEDGSNITGGNFEVQDKAKVHIDGGLAVVNGNVVTNGETTMELNYKTVTDTNVTSGSGGGFTAMRWHEVGN